MFTVNAVFDAYMCSRSAQGEKPRGYGSTAKRGNGKSQEIESVLSLRAIDISSMDYNTGSGAIALNLEILKETMTNVIATYKITASASTAFHFH